MQSLLAILEYNFSSLKSWQKQAYIKVIRFTWMS